MNYESFKQILKSSQIVKMPEHNIATFDKTTFYYQYLSRLSADRTRIRKGQICVHKPLIMLPENLYRMANGFGREADQFVDRVLGKERSELMALGYRFRHKYEKNWMISEALEMVTMNMSLEATKVSDQLIVVGSDHYWEICLLKFLFKIVERSFWMNFEDLEERGMFDPKGLPPVVYQRIETLFKEATRNKKKIKELGVFLLEKGIFEEYEERFFKLLQ